MITSFEEPKLNKSNTPSQTKAQFMSKTAWITLGLSFTFTTSLIYLVHRQQRVEKEVKKI